MRYRHAVRFLVFLVLAIASCTRVDPVAKTSASGSGSGSGSASPLPTDPAPTGPKKMAVAFDWPRLIGASPADAQHAIRRFLKIDGAKDLQALGVDVMVKQDKVSTIFLHIKPERTGGPIYQGGLFRGVEPSMTRDKIVEILGQPDEENPSTIPEHWIKYKKPEAQIHFQFDDQQKIYMVTLIRPDWAPGS